MTNNIRNTIIPSLLVVCTGILFTMTCRDWIVSGFEGLSSIFTIAAFFVSGFTLSIVLYELLPDLLNQD